MWGLWMIGFAIRSTRSSGMALSSFRVRACRGTSLLHLRGACGGIVTGVRAEDAPLRTAPWGTQWGQLNRSLAVWLPRAAAALAAGIASACPFCLVAHSAPFWGFSLRASALRFRIVTWLILPVVICLSQRLSHACLSISNYTVKLRMAH